MSLWSSVSQVGELGASPCSGGNVSGHSESGWSVFLLIVSQVGMSLWWECLESGGVGVSSCS